MMAALQLHLTRAVDVQNGETRLSGFLRQIAHFIIQNKERLPEDARLSLINAFGKRSEPSDPGPNRARPKASEARRRIEQTKATDVRLSPEMRSYIAKIDERPSHFWTAGLSMNINWAGANILRHIYQGNRQNDNVAVISRAFYTTATYLFVQRICHAFSVKILTARVLRYCTGLITDHPDDEDLVRQNLKDDYKAGLIWNTYAEHLGGYGAFFLIGVVPPWISL